MDKITLSLTLELPLAREVLNFVERYSTQINTPTSPAIPSEDKVQAEVKQEPTEAAMASQHTTILQEKNIPVVVKPTAGKKTTMPTFGRTQAQIDAFAKAEAERVEANDEEAELRAQRRADREEKKAIKDEEEAAKKFQENKLAAEVEAIKASEIPTTPIVMPKKPWQI